MAIDVGDWLAPTPAAGPTPHAGLMLVDGRSVPLKAREVRATLHTAAGFSDTCESFNYVSDVEAGCSVQFKFPLPPRSAIYRFEAVIGDRTVRTEVKPKLEAEMEFKEAVQQGHSAVLLQQADSANIFKMDLGNLVAMEECIIKVSYLRMLDSFAGTLEWTHTSTWVPPYLSASDAANLGQVLADTPVFSRDVTYTLSYEVRVLSDVGVASVDSAEDIEVSEAEGCCRLVKLSSKVADPAKDFQLLVELPRGATPPSKLALQRVTRNGATKAVALATFTVPPLPPAPAGAGAGALPEQGPGLVASASQPGLKRELVLVVDCSGSMDGQPIQCAREAALYFIKDLPPHGSVTFNVVCFGSSYKAMQQGCQVYNSESEAAAVTWVQKNVHANLGGTEIHNVLQSIYQQPLPPATERKILFLTDGGISGSEEQQCYNLVDPRKGGAAAGATTLLCMGIGHGVHRSLLDKMAELTSGVVQYVLSSADIVKKCGFLKKCALSDDALTEPRLVARMCVLRMAPASLPARIFAGEPLHVLAEVVRAEPGACLSLTAKRADGSAAEVELPLEEGSPAVHVLPGEALATLHAMAYIGSLLAGTSALHVMPDGSRTKPEPSKEVVKEQVVKLAVDENLVTPYTSSVGVLLQRNPLDPTKTEHIQVPLKTPHGRTLWELTESCDEEYEPPMMMRCMATGSAAPKAKKCMPRSRGFAGAMPPPPPPPCMPAPAPCGAPAPGGLPTPVCMAAPAPMAEAAAPRSGGGVGGFLRGLLGRGGGGAKGGGGAAPPSEPRPGAVMSAAKASRAHDEFEEAEAEEACDDLMMGSGSGCMDVGSSPLEMLEGAEAYAEQKEMDAVPPPRPKPAPAPAAPKAPRDVLHLLNMARTSEGCWHAGHAGLAEALVGQRAAKEGSKVPELVAQVLAAKPAELQADQWMTVLCLAWLKRHLPAERDQWEGMESKALAWLQAAWPQGAKSVGATVLQAMKQL